MSQRGVEPAGWKLLEKASEGSAGRSHWPRGGRPGEPRLDPGTGVAAHIGELKRARARDAALSRLWTTDLICWTVRFG